MVDAVGRPAIGAGIAAGIGHVVLAVAIRNWFGFSWGGPGLVAVGMTAWMILGTGVLGGSVGFVVVRYGLVTPAFVVSGLFSLATYWTWAHVASLDGAAMAPTLTPVTGYMVAWFVVLALALLAGGLEYVVRGLLNGCLGIRVRG